ncbi:RdRP-domain-containing protein [Aureobasidium namibiae CBS 147.97]|uniref:RNA-dependent RNA polymerase n=1 Tax=Aureobasidium namibiae CBS 147.97 TaxID=1043004 RepID=A0A074WN00_9PEZI|nr:RdRP-domain-containing protein [Aureobasidium namibiae CBS 147.97]KEQ74508.1 RdRP-domain-containing protein [Aureobasidium namibiae CBS 147.97]
MSNDTRDDNVRTPESWEPVWIDIDNIPYAHHNALGVHRLLYKYGHVSSINCYGGTKRASALMSFARTSLFSRSLSLGGQKLSIRRRVFKPRLIQSSTNTAKTIAQKVTLPVNQIEFGVMINERHMMVMHTVSSTTDHPITVMLDLASDARHSLEFRFFLTAEQGAPWYRAELRLSISFEVKKIQHEDGHKELVITSQFPPRWWQSVDESLLQDIHSDNREPLNFQDWPRGWRRVTDIDLNPEERHLSPVAFLPPSPVVDTGRWLTWKLSFPVGVDDTTYQTIVDVLENHNVTVQTHGSAEFETVPREDPVVWDLLDPHQASYESDLHQMQDEMMHLGQDIRYQLEVCISNNKFIEHTLTREFLFELSALDKDFIRDPNNPSSMSPALVLLENVADSKQTFFNPMHIFQEYQLRHPRKRRVPKGCVLMRTAIITPTTFYVKTSSVEVSNRVVRDRLYAVENFLRVRFEDEDSFGRLMPMPHYENQHEVWARIERCLRHGIDIAGRHYDWLACGNSQFRERGAYFFTPWSENITARSIRETLGDFSSINVVAKCMARIGQCFSTTRASNSIGGIPDVLIKDIERNGYCFTDGVGKVSPFIAKMVTNELYGNSAPNDYPSAFQFRMGGYKGILVVDPTLKGSKKIHVRPSQRKFDTNKGHTLEIIKPSKFSSSTLNQQLILVLTTRGVPKQVFVDKMTKELQNIDLAMKDESMALNMLQKNVDFNQITLTMSGMILDGFMHSEDPMCEILLQLWRAWNLKHLKYKAKLFIEKGAFVLGCVDETDTLRMDPGELPEIFIQVPGEKEGEWKTAEGVCLLARNPSLHAGDIRVVRAVPCEALKHLKNVVVLPQRGQRPLANMCSGGDLDGDDYLIMWDDDLLPPVAKWNWEPMNYDAPTPVMCVGPVQDEHFVKFFVDYIKNDKLGAIATSHRAIADHEGSNQGVAYWKCEKLAQLHSQAVDFNKTGVPAKVDNDLWPRRWPHWMPGKPKSKQYISREVIGVLYDMVQPEPFAPRLEKPFDRRILDAYVLTDSHLEKARELKIGYDQQIRRVMVQHSIKTEFEVWTAFVMEHNREQHWYSLAEDLGNLMSSIKTDFQAQVKEYLGLVDSGYMISEKTFDILGPFVAAMYTITEQEVTQWKGNRQVSFDEDDMNAPLITYPWLFGRELGKIATRKSGPSALRTAFAANGDVKRRAPVVKSNYKAELHSIKLEPLPEWKPEHAVVDHVEKTAFDVAAVQRLEEKLEITGGDDKAMDEMAVTPKKSADGDAVDGADRMRGAGTEEETEDEVLEEQSSEEQSSAEQTSEDEEAEEEDQEETGVSKEESQQAGAGEAEPRDEGEVEDLDQQGGEEEGAEEGESAYDRLMAMMSL